MTTTIALARLKPGHEYPGASLNARTTNRAQDLSRRYAETLSANKVAKILGIDPKSVARECIAGRLKATRRKTQRTPQQGGDPWSIQRPDLRAFIIEHLGAIDMRKVEKFEFVDILVRTEETP